MSLVSFTLTPLFSYLLAHLFRKKMFRYFYSSGKKHSGGNMFKRLAGLALTLSLCVSSVHASSIDGLKLAYEELSYSLTVEWDQKDQGFRKEKMEIFQKEVEKLQKEGLKSSQMMDYAISQVKDESAKRDIEQKIKLVKMDEMSSSEALKHIQETLDKSLAKGASWNGSVKEQWIIGIIAVIVIVALASRSEGKPEEVRLGPQPDGSFCGYTNVCDYQKNPMDPFGELIYGCFDEYYCVK